MKTCIENDMSLVKQLALVVYGTWSKNYLNGKNESKTKANEYYYTFNKKMPLIVKLEKLKK